MYIKLLHLVSRKYIGVHFLRPRSYFCAPTLKPFGQVRVEEGDMDEGRGQEGVGVWVGGGGVEGRGQGDRGGRGGLEEVKEL